MVSLRGLELLLIDYSFKCELKTDSLGWGVELLFDMLGIGNYVSVFGLGEIDRN